MRSYAKRRNSEFAMIAVVERAKVSIWGIDKVREKGFSRWKDRFLFVINPNIAMAYVLVVIVSLLVTAAKGQNLPQAQCLQSFNGTIGNGTAGSEQQISSVTVRSVNASDANQGVAVDAEYFYSIDNYSISKHNKTTGERLLQWYGGPDGPVIHLDGGVVINGTLYAPHSNYPSFPETSAVEEWNATTLEHTKTWSFGVNRGSLTWIDQDSTGTWYGTFANVSPARGPVARDHTGSSLTKVAVRPNPIRPDSAIRIEHQYPTRTLRTRPRLTVSVHCPILDLPRRFGRGQLCTNVELWWKLRTRRMAVHYRA
jgi:hypothetical protein